MLIEEQSQKFAERDYTPLCAGYPSKQQTAYECLPRPLEPFSRVSIPPVSAEKIMHHSHSTSWFCRAVKLLRRIQKGPSQPLGRSNRVVSQLIPKRLTAPEEEGNQRGIFWVYMLSSVYQLSGLLSEVLPRWLLLIRFSFAWMLS